MKRIIAAIVATLTVPVIAVWSWWQEKRILQLGRHLTATELSFAVRLGIREPLRIKLLAVQRIPLPVPSLLVTWLRRHFDSLVDPAGMTLGHGIFMDAAYADCADIIQHELVHVRQHETHHGHILFMWRYLYECIAIGYENAPLEWEARTLSICED